MNEEATQYPGEEAASDLPTNGNFKMPSVEELLKALEKMDGLTEENKQEIKESLLSRQNLGEGGPAMAVKSGFAPDFLVLMLLITVILFIFVFFGYKLYYALTARDRRREEKKLKKQQKKKK